ncbi:MAG: hypothetical protein EOP83_28545 [Verrucomicrobiaceae bacterium]|nr:MAG: hypothetical protein EOP83_28545 [Verrucomicrobiaceae bacterium]
MRRWRCLIIAIVLIPVTWQAVAFYGRWKYSIQFTFPDGSPAAFAKPSIWVSGSSLPINYQGGGWLDIGKSLWPPTADKSGVYRLGRGRANSPDGLYIVASAWKDGREHAAWVRLESAKNASWPVRLALNPIR